METLINIIVLILCISAIIFFLLLIIALMKVSAEDDRKWEEYEQRQRQKRLAMRIEQEAQKGLNEREGKITGQSEAIRVSRGTASADDMGKDS